MKRRLLAAWLAAWLAVMAPGAQAQDRAALVADTLLVTAEGQLVASGNVQAFYEGATLSAARVTYDPGADRLLIDGPIFLRDANGDILTAERADLDPRLEQGLLQGARLVLDRQLQIAAARAERSEGLTALSEAAATSCQVCAGRAPLWEIRADRVIRDEAAETLTFEDASFLVRGVPILWLPRLRLPEPGNTRATGLLLPRLRGSGELGLGVELPYFLELGPSRDLTLAPFLSPRTLTLEARYRQAFLAGDLEVRGAVSRDELRPGETRGYLAAEGEFALGGGLDLAFAGIVASDGEYLRDYGLAVDGVLESSLDLVRVEGDSLFELDLSAFQDLRDERDATVADLIGELAWERRTDLGAGTLTLGAGLDSVLRTDDGGRDVTRAGAFADWRGDAVLSHGLLVEGQARGALDAYRIADHPSFGDALLRAAPAVAVTLRWPLVRHGGGGTSDLLEPVVALGWSEAYGDEPPNEDSRLPELDEANLFALSRLPGEDAAERGARLSLGLSWTRDAPSHSSTLTFGRILRADSAEPLGPASAWLAAGRVELWSGLAFEARSLLDEDLAPGITEARVDWDSAAFSLEAGYARIPEGGAGSAKGLAEELALDAEFRPSDRWALRTDVRYDLDEDEPRRVGLGVTWRNECVEVDVSAARRYTSPGDEPSTEFGLSIELLGFSAGDGPRVEPGACRG